MNPRGLRVIFGHINRLAAHDDRNSRRVDQIMVHPRYERYKTHDVAILRLTERIPSNNHDVAPLIMRKEANLSESVQCVTMGWGQIYQVRYPSLLSQSHFIDTLYVFSMARIRMN